MRHHGTASKRHERRQQRDDGDQVSHCDRPYDCPSPRQPNICSLATATAVGPTPAPTATFRKKLTDMATPRERFGTTSKIAEKPRRDIPDKAK